MKVELDLNPDGIEYVSRFSEGAGKWLESDNGYVQVLILATDDSRIDTEDKQWVKVVISVTNPEELE